MTGRPLVDRKTGQAPVLNKDDQMLIPEMQPAGDGPIYVDVIRHGAGGSPVVLHLGGAVEVDGFLVGALVAVDTASAPSTIGLTVSRIGPDGGVWVVPEI